MRIMSLQTPVTRQAVDLRLMIPQVTVMNCQTFSLTFLILPVTLIILQVSIHLTPRLRKAI